MERIEVSRGSVHIGEGSIETPKLFYIGERLSIAECSHIGPNGKEHKGNMKVIEITDPVGIGFVAKAVCVQPGCGVEVEVKATF